MNIQKILEELSDKLPKFEDGRIDYSNSNKAVVVKCIVIYNNKILLLKRSEKVATYKGMWNTVAGYIDGFVPIKQKALEEVKEELGVEPENISYIKEKQPYELEDKSINKIWIVCPVLIEIKDNTKTKIDWEHTEFAWVDFKDIHKYNLVPDRPNSLEKIIFEKD